MSSVRHHFASPHREAMKMPTHKQKPLPTTISLHERPNEVSGYSTTESAGFDEVPLPNTSRPSTHYLVAYIDS